MAIITPTTVQDYDGTGGVIGAHRFDFNARVQAASARSLLTAGLTVAPYLFEVRFNPGPDVRDYWFSRAPAPVPFNWMPHPDADFLVMRSVPPYASDTWMRVACVQRCFGDEAREYIRAFCHYLYRG